MSLSILRPPLPASVSQLVPVSLRPSPATLRARRAERVPVLRSRAAPAEKAGQVPAGTLVAPREAGLYRIVRPATFAGHEHDFPVLADLAMKSAKSPSAGWVYGLYAAHQPQPGPGRHHGGAERSRARAQRPVLIATAA